LRVAGQGEARLTYWRQGSADFVGGRLRLGDSTREPPLLTLGNSEHVVQTEALLRTGVVSGSVLGELGARAVRPERARC
jgi:hypothetical protein